VPDTPGLRAEARSAKAGDVIIDIQRVEKDYRALRPLRVRSLQVRERESIALLGFDQASAEVLVNLITAATLPDAGEILIFGTPTATIQTPDRWLDVLDHFGILGERAVVLDEMTVEENLIMPLTMSLHDVDAATRERTRALAQEIGIDSATLGHPVVRLDAAGRVRLRLGRALAARPRVLLAEHPNATLDPAALTAFASDYARIVRARGLTSVLLTADARFAASVATRVLTLQPSTGELKPQSMWSRWLS
jgi:ABC-type polar amino acid transport system ATPase subunit